MDIREMRVTVTQWFMLMAMSMRFSAIPGKVVSLKAPFTGTHGWYWKNTSDRDVVIKLKASGFYSEIKKQ